MIHVINAVTIRDKLFAIECVSLCTASSLNRRTEVEARTFQFEGTWTKEP